MLFIFYCHGPTIGIGLSGGVNVKEIRARKGDKFNIDDYEGSSSGYTGGIGFLGMEYSGNRTHKSYRNSDWNFKGASYNQFGWSAGLGGDVGIMWSRTTTSFFGKK